MRFLQTSDWHLGRLLFDSSLLEDQQFFINQIIKQIKTAEEENNPYDALLIPGDIYDRANPGKETMALLSDTLSNITAQFPQLHIFILSGNHDDSRLLYFAKDFFARGNVHICTDVNEIDKPFVLKDAVIYQIPYLEAYAFPEKRKQQDLYETACSLIKSHYEKNHKDKMCIVCAHLFTIHATIGDAERSNVGPAEEVDAQLFKDFYYTAAGHIHSFQPCGNSKNMNYSGAPMKYNPDNKDRQEKFMLDIAAQKNELPAVSKIPIQPLHKITHIEGSFDDYTKNFEKNYETLIKPFENDYIIFSCTDEAAPPSPLPALQKIFPYIKTFRMKNKEVAKNQSSFEQRRTLIENVEEKPEMLFKQFLKDMNAYDFNTKENDNHAENPEFIQEQETFLKYFNYVIEHPGEQ